MPHSRLAFLASGAALGTAPLLGCGPRLRDLRLPGLPAALDEMRRLGPRRRCNPRPPGAGPRPWNTWRKASSTP
jgi:hypothetical protein